jgi:hypothetical protein
VGGQEPDLGIHAGFSSHILEILAPDTGKQRGERVHVGTLRCVAEAEGQETISVSLNLEFAFALVEVTSSLGSNDDEAEADVVLASLRLES